MPLVADRQRTVIRASIDGFHRPRFDRYRRGRDSPEGYYRDSFDYDALKNVLLDPLCPGGSRRYRTAVFDVCADSAFEASEQVAPNDAVLLFDGVFLLRAELAPFCDFSIFVAITSEEALRRGVARDAQLFGSTDAARERYARRYAGGQALYLEAVRPREKADVVVENTNPDQPELLRPDVGHEL